MHSSHLSTYLLSTYLHLSLQPYARTVDDHFGASGLVPEEFRPP